MKINESSKENIIKECAMEGRLGKKAVSADETKCQPRAGTGPKGRVSPSGVNRGGSGGGCDSSLPTDRSEARPPN